MREEFAKVRKPGVPDAPTHGALVAKAGGAKDATVYAEGDSATGTTDRDAVTQEADPEAGKVLKGER